MPQQPSGALSADPGSEPIFPVYVGRCIYCSAVDSLSDEHVIPHSLGGPWELKAASCARCAKITSRLERHISREHLLALRTVAEFPTYRPKGRPRQLPQIVTIGGDDVQLSMTPAEHPAPIVLPVFDRPAFLTGAETPSPPHVLAARVFSREKGLFELAVTHGATGYKVPLPDRSVFARFIAKVGLGFAVGGLGLDRFAEVFVREAILGETDDVARWVGCLPDQSHTSGRGTHEIVTLQDGDLVSVVVRLFSGLASPEYLVIVGRTVDTETTHSGPAA